MATFGKRGAPDQRESGRIDRHRPDQTGLMPERDAPRILYHDKNVMFWGLVAIICLLPLAFYLYKGSPPFGSWTGSAFLVAFGIGMAFFLRATGQLDDKPEQDLRGFFVGGPVFLIGAGLWAVYFFWNNGVSWIWAYDLTDVNFGAGFKSLGNATNSTGLMGFLGKLTTLLGGALAAGAVLKQIAIKTGLDDMFKRDSNEHS